MIHAHPNRPNRTASPRRILATAVAACAFSLLTIGCSNTPRSEVPYSVLSEDRDFARGAERTPIPETLYSVSRLLVVQGRDGEADPILRRSIREHPDFIPSYFELAEIEMRAGRLGSAMETLTAAHDRDPENALLLNNIGMCWLLRDEYNRALEYFTRAAAKDPDDARFRANMATALGMSGRYDESFSLFRQVLNPGFSHYNVGVIALARDDHQRAVEEFSAALHYDKNLTPPPDARGLEAIRHDPPLEEMLPTEPDGW